MIWCVELGDRKEKRLVDCTATVLSLLVQGGEEEGASWMKQTALLESHIDFHLQSPVSVQGVLEKVPFWLLHTTLG